MKITKDPALKLPSFPHHGLSKRFNTSLPSLAVLISPFPSSSHRPIPSAENNQLQFLRHLPPFIRPLHQPKRLLQMMNAQRQQLTSAAGVRVTLPIYTNILIILSKECHVELREHIIVVVHSFSKDKP